MTTTWASRPPLRRLALAIGLLTAAATSGEAATALRWKFRAGEVLRYESLQTTTSKVKDPSGQEVGQTLTLTMDQSWAVREVDPQGVASLAMTIDRIRTTATLPFGKFSFDSKEDGGAAGSPAAPLFKLLVGAEFTFKMSPRGEMTDIQLSEKLRAALAGEGQAPGAQGQFTESGLKNMLVQLGLVLPEGEAEPGRTWARKVAVPGGPGGPAREIDQTFTYSGPEAGKPLEAVEMTTKFDPVAPDPNVPIAIKSQEASGHYAFDNAAGRVETSRVVEKVEVSGQLQGKEVGQSNETVTVMTLQHEKAP